MDGGVRKCRAKLSTVSMNLQRKESRPYDSDKACLLQAVHGKHNIGRRVLRGRTLVASADKAWAIRGLEGTGGKARRGRVLSDEGGGGGDERGRSRQERSRER
jgi:hypothetical protein